MRAGWVGYGLCCFMASASAEQRLEYQKPHALSQLHDEILAAVPAVAPQVGADGRRHPVMTVHGTGETIVLLIPDGINRVPIDLVVSAHVPIPPYDPTADQAELATLDAQLDTDYATWDSLPLPQQLAVFKKRLRADVLKRRLGQ